MNSAPPLSLVDAGYMTSGCSISSMFPDKPVENHQTTKKVRQKKSTKGETKAFRQERKQKRLGIVHQTVGILPKCKFKCSEKVMWMTDKTFGTIFV